MFAKFNAGEVQKSMLWKVKNYKLPKVRTTYVEMHFNFNDDTADVFHIVFGTPSYSLRPLERTTKRLASAVPKGGRAVCVCGKVSSVQTCVTGLVHVDGQSVAPESGLRVGHG